MHSAIQEDLSSIFHSLRPLQVYTWYGYVTSVTGLLVSVCGVSHKVYIGSVVSIQAAHGKKVWAQVIGFRNKITLLMAYDSLEGIHSGSRVDVSASNLYLYPHDSWKGRVLDGLGRPMDNKGPLAHGVKPCSVNETPPPAYQRKLVGRPIDLGVRSLNLFTTCCLGQRMGIFSGSGVGKSTLLGKIACHASCDTMVIGLVGERGREVNEFIHDHMGPQGMQNTIVVVATSDTPALIRRQAAYTTLAIAEYFRNEGQNVLCMIDSITRFAAAQREIGLSAGEPPATRGYPPTVFSELPRLLERAGPGLHTQGNITGLFTVLVEGDDLNEPVSDTVRSILDGHIVLSRSLAEKGHYPSVDVLKSLSRAMPKCNSPEETNTIQKARKIIFSYENMEEIIQLGAYRQGSSAATDEAIRLYPLIMKYLLQQKEDKTDVATDFLTLQAILSS